jgi:nucleoside-diphosphate-sugar epimerase
MAGPGGVSGRLLTLGHGYVARHLASALLAQGWQVTGTTRNPERLPEIAGSGAAPLLFEASRPEALHAAVARAGHLLVSAAPSPAGDPILPLLGPALRAADHLAWIGYLSTTGVYGDHDGAWVDEESPCRPASARNEARLRAEAEWLDLAQAGRRVTVFRLAGIYGPGRNALLRVAGGEARMVIKPGQFFSRIHVRDIVQALTASIAAKERTGLYNVADDEPAPPEAPLSLAAELLGLPPPPRVAFEEAELSDMARSFYSENKRVSNRRMKEALGVRLLYPTYREGLRALHAAGEGRA